MASDSYHIFVNDVDYEEEAALPGLIVPQEAIRSLSYFPQETPCIRFFVNGQLGVHIQTARDAPSEHAILDNAADKHTVSTASSIENLCILWPGYDRWSTFANLIVGTQPDREQVARKVASAIWKFYQDMSSTPCTKEGWRLENCPFDSLYLVKLRRVGQRVWQPVILWRFK